MASASRQLISIAPHNDDNQEIQSRPPATCKTSAWLVFSHGCSNCKCEKKIQTFFNISEKQCHINWIHELEKCRYWPTPQGWLLVEEEKSHQLHLLSPTTMEKIKLPPLDWDLPRGSRCFLSSPKIGPNCMIMCGLPGSLFFCHLKDENWTRYDTEEIEMFNICAHNNNFYFTNDINSLGIIEFHSTVRTRILEDIKIDNFHGFQFLNSFLLESSGDLFTILRFMSMPCCQRKNTVYHFDVAKRDSINKTWNIVHSIGDRVFFLGCNKFAASCSASELGVKGNCIYFLLPYHEYFYIFDMEMGRISDHLPCPNANSSWSTPIWIMPSV